MPPKKLGNNFKTIRIICKSGHEVARYRKPRAEWGERTHKLWLVEERIAQLDTQPPILVEDVRTGHTHLEVPDTDTHIRCGDSECNLEIGKIAIVGGAVALKLAEQNLKPTKG